MDRLTFAVDSREGKVAIKGWRESLRSTTSAMMQALEPYCSGFLYTHIDTEGPSERHSLDVVRPLRAHHITTVDRCRRHCSQEEVDQLDALGD